MPNHFHLVLAAELERLSHGMHTLNFRYAAAYNSRHDRAGHLFQNRFYAEAIEDERHLGNLCEYVLDNPVRAQLCAERAAWGWSGGRYA
jgi:REP element-mobilizing transposase RayT